MVVVVVVAIVVVDPVVVTTAGLPDVTTGTDEVVGVKVVEVT